MTEYELITKAIRGDKKSVIELIKKEQNNIYTTLYYMKRTHEDINDIAQIILLKIYNKITQLKNPQSFKTWLNRIIVNTYYDYLRKKKYEPDTINDDSLYNQVDLKNNPQDSILYNELDIIIKRTIKNLPNHYKIPITLREVQGLSYNEISNVTGASIGTVKSRISRARDIIQEKITKYTKE